MKRNKKLILCGVGDACEGLHNISECQETRDDVIKRIVCGHETFSFDM
jgi:hypothetical protein